MIMKKIIISDTTTLIVLERQQHWFLLCKLFKQVIIPVAVYEELLVGLENDNPLKNIKCIRIEPVASSSQLNNLLIILDKGEAEAIELAVKKQLPLIIDERNILNSKQAKNLLNMAVQDGYRLSKLLHDQVNKILSN